MSKTLNITAEEREIGKKSKVKDLRNAGVIPGVFYGKSVKDNIHLQVNEKELKKVLKSEAGLNVILNLTIKGKSGEHTEAVIPQDIQFNPVTDRVVHIDFRKINLKEKITTKVPVRITGTAPGVALGGILMHQLHEVEVRCLPMDIPSHIAIDVSSLATVNSVIKVGEIKFPENVEPIHLHNDQVAVAVVPPKEEKVETTEAPLEQSVEPELIKTKGKEDKEGEEGAEKATDKAAAPAKEGKEGKEAAPKADAKK